MTVEELANTYFTREDPIKTIASYIALLVLRFERRSNYEKIINVEEIVRPLKTEIALLLGPSQSYRAYITAIEFLERLFKEEPSILEAEKRFRLLEKIESEKYHIIRRHYLTIVESNIHKIQDNIKITLSRMLNDIKYGKIHMIDRTCSGSCYISKIDLLSKYLGNDIRIINEFSENLAKIGILKPTYLRIIIPAPLLEDSFIRKMIQNRELRNIIETLDSTLLLLGYYRELLEKKENIDILQYIKNIEGTTRYRLRIMITDKLEDNIEKHVKNIGNTFNIIIAKHLTTENIRRKLEEIGVPVIVCEDYNPKYISEKIIRILLEISSLKYLKDIKDLIDNIIETLI